MWSDKEYEGAMSIHGLQSASVQHPKPRATPCGTSRSRLPLFGARVGEPNHLLHLFVQISVSRNTLRWVNSQEGRTMPRLLKPARGNNVEGIRGLLFHATGRLGGFAFPSIPTLASASHVTEMQSQKVTYSWRRSPHFGLRWPALEHHCFAVCFDL